MTQKKIKTKKLNIINIIELSASRPDTTFIEKNNKFVSVKCITHFKNQIKYCKIVSVPCVSNNWSIAVTIVFVVV